MESMQIQIRDRCPSWEIVDGKQSERSDGVRNVWQRSSKCFSCQDKVTEDATNYRVSLRCSWLLSRSTSFNNIIFVQSGYLRRWTFFLNMWPGR